MTMTRDEAKWLASFVRAGLPKSMETRLKAIHIAPHLHEGHTTIRVFTVPKTADDPEPFVFAADELGAAYLG